MYEAQGFIVITLLGENNAGGPASQADVVAWANEYNLTHPVVADPQWQTTTRYVSSSFSLPSMHQLAPGMEVLRRQAFVTEQQVIDALP